MLDHVSIRVADLERSASFYDRFPPTIGFDRRVRRRAATGYGPSTRPAPIFWLLAAAPGERCARPRERAIDRRPDQGCIRPW